MLAVGYTQGYTLAGGGSKDYCKMSENATLMRYRDLLQEQAELKKRDIDLSVEIAICCKQMEIGIYQTVARVTVADDETQRFINEYGDQLESEDREFLEETHRSPAQVRELTSWSDSKLKRLEKCGQISARRNDAGHRMYSTISVMRFYVDVNAKKKR